MNLEQIGFSETDQQQKRISDLSLKQFSVLCSFIVDERLKHYEPGINQADKILTIKEAATMLGRSVSWLYGRYDIKPISSGTRNRRYRKSDLEKYIKEQG